MACPSCGAATNEGDQFCEACGAQLSSLITPAAASTTCASCGAVDKVLDGYCSVCGIKQPSPHDHEEFSRPGVGAVTDKGIRHFRNEDAMAVVDGANGALVVIVSDGVSTTQRPDEASQATVAAASAVLAKPGEPDFNAAVTAAREAVLALTYEPAAELGAPSCTFLGAVITDDDVTLGSLGDCRSYWVDASGGRQLTTDDSWAHDQISAGVLTTEAAFADHRAHAITKWLGADGDPEWRPAVTAFVPPGPGRLILCSDGLWNYTLEPADLVAAMGEETDALAIARRLTTFANDAGGQDNITVVVVDLPCPQRSPATQAVIDRSSASAPSLASNPEGNA